LKTHQFFRGETTQHTPIATRIQSGQYGTEAGDIIETNILNHSVKLAPAIVRQLEAVINKNRIVVPGGGASGSQSWTFTIRISHPNEADKYYTFNSCAVTAPIVELIREDFGTNSNPNLNTTIIILKVNGKKIFSHPGEKTIEIDGTPGSETRNVQYQYEVYRSPREGSAQCTPPEDKPEQGPGGLYELCWTTHLTVLPNYEFARVDHPCGTGDPGTPTPPPENPTEDTFNPYTDRSCIHWHSLCMGDRKQVITMRSEFALSTGPSPNPLTGISKNETFLIDADGQEVLIGGTKPEAFSPRDNLLTTDYHRVDDSPLFPPPSTPPPIPPLSSIRSLLVDSYTLGTTSTKLSKSYSILPIPDSAIVQNCSFHPE
jgi:hypothetical protein